MAKLLGELNFQGTIGNLTFYKSKYGMIVKTKSSVSKSRIKNDPVYARMRENNNEFGHACKAGKLFRLAVRSSYDHISDGGMYTRLMREMLKITKTDKINDRGSRNVVLGNLQSLKGFNFNDNAALTKLFNASFETCIDRLKGRLKIRIPSFCPTTALVSPVTATHAKLISAGAGIDFMNNDFESKRHVSDLIPLTNGKTKVINIIHQVSANNAHPLFLLLGVKFYQESEGKYEHIKDLPFNALSIVAVGTT